ncbi:MAG TPA: TonB-dependent receptor, partial [Opitutaceae bacterium]|nr:TonB-dependent receptor [Opitutaceae bacterium]
PTFTPYQKVIFTAGSRDLERGEINVNQPLGFLGSVRFAQLFSASGQNNSSTTPYGASRNRLIDENLLAQFKDGSSLNAEVEWSKRKEVTSTSTVPFQYNTATKTYSSIERQDLGHFSQGGPDSVQNRELTSVYLTYEKRYNEVWSNRAGGYVYARHAFNFNNGSSDQFDPTTGKFGRGNVITDPLNEDGGAFQIDTLADYSLLNGKIKNKTLATIDVSENWRYREQHQANQNLYPITGVNINNLDYSLPLRSAFNIITRRDKVRWDTKGFFFRQQTTVLDDRLIGFLGIRRDIVTYNLNFGDQYNASGKTVGTVKTPGSVSHYTDTAWSPNFGANYKLTSNISLYVSHSTSFSPAGQVAKLGDPHLANETSVGWDYGIKASFFEDKLIFTTGGYYIDRYGVKTTVIDPVTGLSETVAAGTQLSKGVEFEGSWRPIDNLTILGSYSYVNARIVYNGSRVTDVGQMPAALPVDQGSVAVKYNFTGQLKGLAWNAGVIYVGRAFPNSTATDARRNVDAPGFVLVNMGVSYSWKQSSPRFKHTVRLSSKNLFNRAYLDSKGNLGDGRGVYVAYALEH